MANHQGGPSGDESVGELVSELGRQVGELVTKEMQLARSELSEEVAKGVKATVSLSAAAVAGLLAVVFLSSAAAWGLAEVMDAGWAFLIVGSVHLVAAGVLFATGRREAGEIDPVPRETLQTLKEDAQWAKNRTS